MILVDRSGRIGNTLKVAAPGATLFSMSRKRLAPKDPPIEDKCRHGTIFLLDEVR